MNVAAYVKRANEAPKTPLDLFQHIFIKSFEDQIFVLKAAVQEKSQWEQTIGQKKKQKKEQKEELIKQEIKEEENDEEIRVEKFCNQMFPVLTAIRKKIRQFLKYRGSWPVPEKYIEEFYKRREMSSDETKDQLLLTMSVLDDNLSTHVGMQQVIKYLSFPKQLGSIDVLFVTTMHFCVMKDCNVLFSKVCRILSVC
jgi:hypothetical protein